MNIYGNNLDFNKKDQALKGINYIIIKHFKDYPFFSNLLLNSSDIQDIEDSSTILAYTYFNFDSDRNKICINYKLLENGMFLGNNLIKFDEEDIFTILLHELLHNFFEHMTRFKKESKIAPSLINVITDFYINEFLMELYPPSKSFIKKVGAIDYHSLKETALFFKGKPLFFPYNDTFPLDRVTVEWFFQDLKNDLETTIGFSIGNHEKGEEEESKSLEGLNKQKRLDNKIEISEEVASSLKKNYFSSQLVQAKEFDLSKDEREFLERITSFNLKEPFLNFIKIKNTISKVCSLNNIRTYSRGNRKKTDDEIIWKGKKREEGLKVVIAIDVSGSISNRELYSFYSMIASFLKKQEGKLVSDIIYWSSEKLTDKHLHKNISTYKELSSLKILSDGGTDVETLYNFIEENYKEKISLINITDGFWTDYKIPSNVKDHYLILTYEKTYMEKKRNPIYANTNIRFYDRI